MWRIIEDVLDSVYILLLIQGEFKIVESKGYDHGTKGPRF